jgi:hypothetical protein
MKQTAVEWLYRVLIFNPVTIEHFEHNKKCLEQAKEMEKQQQGYSEEEVVEFANWKDINCFQVMDSNHLFYIRGCKKYDEGYANKELFETFKNK